MSPMPRPKLDAAVRRLVVGSVGKSAYARVRHNLLLLLGQPSLLIDGAGYHTEPVELPPELEARMQRLALELSRDGF